MSEDSAKILTEKLALSRELAVLRPELDHLRSQLDHQKDVLTQKLALERQLSNLEVELANEKRIAQTVFQSRDSRSTKLEEELKSRVSDLERELIAAERASEKAKGVQNKAQSGTEQKLQQQITELEKRLATEQKASEQVKKTQKKAQDESEKKLRQQIKDLEKKLVEAQRAAPKSKRQDSNDGAEQTELKGKLKQLEQDLETERRETERAQKTNEKEAAAARDHIEMLTQRLEEFKTKLRETRAELKELRVGMTQARTTTTTVPIRNAEEPKKPLSRTKGAGKRRANEVTVDEMMLDSPDYEDGKTKRVAQAKKKRGAYDITTVGEKSTFSITPFLEKSNTISLGETIEEVEEPSVLDGKGNAAVPIVEPEAEEEADIPVPDKQPMRSVAKALKATKTKPASAEQKKARGKLKAQALTEISPNIDIAANAAPLDDEVVEATQKPTQQNGPAAKASTSTKPSSAATQSAETTSAGVNVPEPKKKKRKVLGTGNKGTIFDDDEDDGEFNAGISTVASAATKRKPVAIKGAGRQGPVTALSRGALTRKSFSPLKKHRRGVGASFLV